jgi:hypothetical protein
LAGTEGKKYMDTIKSIVGGFILGFILLILGHIVLQPLLITKVSETSYEETINVPGKTSGEIYEILFRWFGTYRRKSEIYTTNASKDDLILLGLNVYQIKIPFVYDQVFISILEIEIIGNQCKIKFTNPMTKKHSDGTKIPILSDLGFFGESFGEESVVKSGALPKKVLDEWILVISEIKSILNDE